MSLDRTTILQLASVPPPRLKFLRAKDAHVEIMRIETLLGVAHSPFVANMGDANLRIEILQQLLAAKVASASTPPAPAAPVALPPPVSGRERFIRAMQTKASQPAARTVGVFGRARFIAACKSENEK